MGDYIERKTLIREIISNMASFIGTPDEVQKHDEQCNYAISCIEDALSADVAPVVNGQWILHHTVIGSPYTECSHCCTDFAFKTDRGTLAKLDMRGMPYCPRCGAKMAGGI